MPVISAGVIGSAGSLLGMDETLTKCHLNAAKLWGKSVSHINKWKAGNDLRSFSGRGESSELVSLKTAKNLSVWRVAREVSIWIQKIFGTRPKNQPYRPRNCPLFLRAGFQREGKEVSDSLPTIRSTNSCPIKRKTNEFRFPPNVFHLLAISLSLVRMGLEAGLWELEKERLGIIPTIRIYLMPRSILLLRIRKRKWSIFLLPAFPILPDITCSEWRGAPDAN